MTEFFDWIGRLEQFDDAVHILLENLLSMSPGSFTSKLSQKNKTPLDLHGTVLESSLTTATRE
jgi:hypothetical protein